MGVKIFASGHSCGDSLITNEKLFERISNFDAGAALVSLKKKGVAVDENDEAQVFSQWVKQVCGIAARPFFEKEIDKKLEVEELAFRAVESMLTQGNIDRETLRASIDEVIFSTYSGNRTMPSPACTLIERLGLTNSAAITMNGACSGFLDALIDASIKVEARHRQKVLVVASEQLSNKMDFDDPKSSIIFSDGSGAFLVKYDADNTRGVLGFASGTSFSEQVYMETKSHIFFKAGPLVERNAIRTMFSICEKAFEDVAKKHPNSEHSSLNFGDIDYVIPHQANLRIIDGFESKIQASISGGKYPKVIKRISELGNLSSATLPVSFDLLLKEEFDNDFSKLAGKKIIFVSVGGGYTFSSLVYQF